jgi:hypothetical protein
MYKTYSHRFWSTTHSTSTFHTFFAARSAAESRFGRLTSRPGRWTKVLSLAHSQPATVDERMANKSRPWNVRLFCILTDFFTPYIQHHSSDESDWLCRWAILMNDYHCHFPHYSQNQAVSNVTNFVEVGTSFPKSWHMIDIDHISQHFLSQAMLMLIWVDMGIASSIAPLRIQLRPAGWRA